MQNKDLYKKTLLENSGEIFLIVIIFNLKLRFSTLKRSGITVYTAKLLKKFQDSIFREIVL